MTVKLDDSLWGHEKEYDCFKQAIFQNKLHHAWLICGEVGVGKKTFVNHVIRLILGSSENVLAKIKAGSHPDLLTVSRRIDEKKNRLRSEILMDDIKAVGTFLRLTSANGGWRIVIIEEADLMNQNAANSLLKILEEPPDAALIFLITAHPNRLLPTILSRCRKLMLHPLSNTVLLEALIKLAPEYSEAEYQKIITLSQGSIGKALSLLNSDASNLQNIVDAFFEKPFKGSELNEKVKYILQKEDGFSVFFSLLTDKFNMLIGEAIKSRQKRFGNPSRTVMEWIDIWQKILKWHKDTESFNLDKRQTLISDFELVSEL